MKQQQIHNKIQLIIKQLQQLDEMLTYVKHNKQNTKSKEKQQINKIASAMKILEQHKLNYKWDNALLLKVWRTSKHKYNYYPTTDNWFSEDYYVKGNGLDELIKVLNTTI